MSVLFLHLETFSNQTSSFCDKGSERLWGNCPITVFANISLNFNGKCRKFEKAYRREPCINHINCTEIEQGSRGDKGRKFCDFLGRKPPNMDLSKWNLAQRRKPKFLVNPLNESLLRDENLKIAT